MSKVKSKGSKAERLLRAALWQDGLRYRLHDPKLIGRPDLTFRGSRIAVFVDGDFWHGRSLIEGGLQGLRSVVRGPSYERWQAKLLKNVERDREVSAALTADGWLVKRYWESAILEDVRPIAQEIAQLVKLRQKRPQSPKGATSLVDCADATGTWN